jgi:hypothetical protein
MTQSDDKAKQATEEDISAPRLTPQGRAGDGKAEGSTKPIGEGAKKGQPDKAEG